MEDFKTKFNQKIIDLSANKAYNSTVLSRENYNQILSRLCDLNSNKEAKKSSSDLRLLNRYTIREFDMGGQVTRRLIKSGTNLPFVCCEVFI
jgi:hypothetical protein